MAMDRSRDGGRVHIWLLVTVAVLFVAVYLVARSLRQHALKDQLAEAAAQEASYLFQNLEDRLLFIAGDLRDVKRYEINLFRFAKPDALRARWLNYLDRTQGPAPQIVRAPVRRDAGPTPRGRRGVPAAPAVWQPEGIYLNSLNSAGPPAAQAEHSEKVHYLLRANRFLQTINYIGPDRRIRYVCPVEGNREVVGLKVEIAQPKAALEKALASGEPRLSPPFEIMQGETGYSLMVPAPGGGILEIVFKTESVFGAASPFRRGQHVAVRILDGGVVAYECPDFHLLGVTSRPVGAGANPDAFVDETLRCRLEAAGG